MKTRSTIMMRLQRLNGEQLDALLLHVLCLTDPGLVRELLSRCRHTRRAALAMR